MYVCMYVGMCVYVCQCFACVHINVCTLVCMCVCVIVLHVCISMYNDCPDMAHRTDFQETNEKDSKNIKLYNMYAVRSNPVLWIKQGILLEYVPLFFF